MAELELSWGKEVFSKLTGLTLFFLHLYVHYRWCTCVCMCVPWNTCGWMSGQLGEVCFLILHPCEFRDQCRSSGFTANTLTCSASSLALAYFLFFWTKLDFDLQNWIFKNTYLLCVWVCVSYYASLGRMTFTTLCISVWRHMCNTMQMKVGGNITLCVCVCACVHMCHTM